MKPSEGIHVQGKQVFKLVCKHSSRFRTGVSHRVAQGPQWSCGSLHYLIWPLVFNKFYYLHFGIAHIFIPGSIDNLVELDFSDNSDSMCSREV